MRGGYFMVSMWFYTLLVILDYLTGIAGAYVSNKLDSKITREGLIRKAIILLVLWSVFIFANIIIPTYIEPDFISPFDSLETIITSGFIIYEVISLTENLGILGVKVPVGVQNSFKRIRDHIDEQNSEGE